MVSFSDLGIEGSLIRVLRQQGIEEPFEVQREAIPDALLGRDVCCRAPTGSGKTLAFGLPLLSRTERAKIEMPTSLILTPTRELAEQICKVLNPLARAVDLEVLAVYGGTSYSRQRKALQNGVDIIVACPGRLEDLLQSDYLTLEDVSIVVLDEADRMADMGFMDPVCRILDKCSPRRQTILYSATLDDEVAVLVEKYQKNPVHIGVGPKEVSMDSMRHLFWMVRGQEKPEIAFEAIQKVGRTVLFCRTRAGVDRVGDELSEFGMEVSTLHGGLNQRQRDRAMKRFTGSRSQVLIATDVAARGIDIEGVHCVIHYDPPENGKAYKHRSGRTARAGTDGTVISLVQKPQKRLYIRLQRDVGIKCEMDQGDLEELPSNEFNLVESEGGREGRQSRGKNRSNDAKPWWDQKRRRGNKGPRKVNGRRNNHSRNGRNEDRGSRHDRRSNRNGRDYRGHQKGRKGPSRFGQKNARRRRNSNGGNRRRRN